MLVEQNILEITDSGHLMKFFVFQCIDSWHLLEKCLCNTIGHNKLKRNRTMSPCLTSNGVFSSCACCNKTRDTFLSLIFNIFQTILSDLSIVNYSCPIFFHCDNFETRVDSTRGPVFRTCKYFRELHRVNQSIIYKKQNFGNGSKRSGNSFVRTRAKYA